MNDLVLHENDSKAFEKSMNEEGESVIKHFERELLKIRTGRAHTSLIEDIPVSCYGAPAQPLKQIAALAAPEARLLTIQPWDTNVIANIEKAIHASDLGLTPANDGNVIRIILPEMSTTRRDDLKKILGKKLEECKVSLRGIRKEYNNFIRLKKKDKTISENFFNRIEETVQSITDRLVKKADELARRKENEIHIT